MFYCPDCGFEFEKAKKIYEDHGLSAPPFETVGCCPECKGTGIYEKEESHCRCCGAKLSKGIKDYCSAECKRKGEKLWRKQLKNRKKIYESPLNQIIREVTKYNKENGTSYSYGQYVAFIKQTERKKKNDK